MAREEKIRDARGVIIGTYVYESNGDITVRDSLGIKVGSYSASRNATLDVCGVMIAKGKVIGMLLR